MSSEHSEPEAPPPSAAPKTLGSKAALIMPRLVTSLTRCALIKSVAFSILLSQTLQAPAAPAQSQPDSIPFEYAAGHVLVIPVLIGDKQSTFILDTGAGVNVISQTLARSLPCSAAGNVTGQRMSGQKVTMKQVIVPSLQIGSRRQSDLPMATWKLEDVFAGAPDMAKVEGLVSLEFFKGLPFTIDYGQKRIFIETNASLKDRASAGVSVPIQVTKKRNQTSVAILLWFSNGSFAKVEVDTGSGALILDEHYMKELGVLPPGPDMRTVNGVDETGNAYVRYFTKIPLDVFIAQNRKFTQSKPMVQFQKIIYDGLVGDGFLHNFTVTFDLPHKRMIFAPGSKQL